MNESSAIIEKMRDHLDDYIKESKHVENAKKTIAQKKINGEDTRNYKQYLSSYKKEASKYKKQILYLFDNFKDSFNSEDLVEAQKIINKLD